MYTTILGFSIGLLILIVGRFASKRKFLSGRENLTDVELIKLFSSDSIQRGERVISVLIVVGRCYGVSYKKLRPSDYFKGGLSEIDSWRAGVGSIRFQHFLVMEFGSKSPINKRLITIEGLFRELGI